MITKYKENNCRKTSIIWEQYNAAILKADAFRCTLTYNRYLDAR